MALFGNALHVAADDEAARARPAIAASGIAVQRVERIEPSLEDAFVAIIQERAETLAMSLRTIRAIMRRELIDVLRDRRSLFLTLLYPITMLLMYGFGIRYDVDNVQLTILDYSETPASRELVQDLTSSGYFRLVRFARNEADVDRDLDHRRGARRGDHSLRLRRPLRIGKPTAVQVLIDGSESNTATIAQGYALAIINGYEAKRLGGRMPAHAPIEVRSARLVQPRAQERELHRARRHRRDHDDRRRHRHRAEHRQGERTRHAGTDPRLADPAGRDDRSARSCPT